jgi:hypothetical protein
VGLSYGTIAILEKQKNKLQDLNSEISRMLKGYQLGSKSNPVGYSGLLGMKSLANRLNGILNQYEAQVRSHYAGLKEFGLNDSQWTPETIDSSNFVNRFFPIRGDSSPSYKMESAKENVKASEQIAKMEKAKFLPKVGAFAEGAIFDGTRSSATNYSAGLYLQWSLFNPTNFGSIKEAKLKALAAAKYSEASEQQERAEKAALIENMKSLRENLVLLDDSYKILVEQSKITRTLFRNGSINALQIVEILNRRTDLILQQSDAELGLINIASQIVTKEKFNISQQLNSGVKQ